MSNSGSVVLIVALVVVGIVLIHQSLAAGRPLGLGSTFASGSKLPLVSLEGVVRCLSSFSKLLLLLTVPIAKGLEVVMHGC